MRSRMPGWIVLPTLLIAIGCQTAQNSAEPLVRPMSVDRFPGLNAISTAPAETAPNPTPASERRAPTPSSAGQLARQAPRQSSTSSRIVVRQTSHWDQVPSASQVVDREDEFSAELEPSSNSMAVFTPESAAELAIANSPDIQRLLAQGSALAGKWEQVGLDTNPEFGYVAAETGADSRFGQQGVYLGKQIIRGDKRGLNRQTVCRQMEVNDLEIEILRQQLSTDAKLAVYRVRVLQDRIETLQRFVRLNQSIQSTAEQLFDGGEISLLARMQADLLGENTGLLIKQTESEWNMARGQLAAVLNLAPEQLPTVDFAVDLTPLETEVNLQATLESILMDSPELQKARAQVLAEHAQLDRELAEQIVDVDVQANLSHDFSSDDELLFLQVVIPLQVNDWNQGGIRQAEGQILVASQQVEGTVASLRRRFAAVWKDYQLARNRLVQLNERLLPKTAEVFELVQQAFADGEVGYLDVINAQQSYLNSSLQRNTALGQYWQSVCLLEGQLLSAEIAR